MSKEQEKLQAMFNEGKISEEDFKMLSQAIQRNDWSLASALSLIGNPFKRLSGWPALIAGSLIIFSMSYLGVYAKVYFTGVLDILNSVAIKNPRFSLNLLLLLYQNVVCWLILSGLYFGAAKIFQKKGVRIIDVLGMVALSRYPYLVATAFIAVIQFLDPSFMNIDLSKGIQFHLSFTTMLFGLVVVLCSIWQITTYFYALKESTGLLGKNLWISFIVALLIGEVVSWPLTMIFF